MDKAPIVSTIIKTGVKKPQISQQLKVQNRNDNIPKIVAN
jgi:hypothetical protein